MTTKCIIRAIIAINEGCCGSWRPRGEEVRELVSEEVVMTEGVLRIEITNGSKGWLWRRVFRVEVQRIPITWS